MTVHKCEWKSESEVAQSCPTLCDHMDCSLSGSSVHGVFQARVLEWIAISFSRWSSWPRNWTRVSCIAGRCFTVWATRETHETSFKNANLSMFPRKRFLQWLPVCRRRRKLFQAVKIACVKLWSWWHMYSAQVTFFIWIARLLSSWRDGRGPSWVVLTAIWWSLHRPVFSNVFLGAYIIFKIIQILQRNHELSSHALPYIALNSWGVSVWPWLWIIGNPVSDQIWDLKWWP